MVNFKFICQFRCIIFFQIRKVFLENLDNILSILNLNIILYCLILFYLLVYHFILFKHLVIVLMFTEEKLDQQISLILLYLYHFFPQLVAGPIIRAKDFLPQLVRKTILTIKRLNLGAFLIISGLFKKIVIADSIAPMINNIFNKPRNIL